MRPHKYIKRTGSSGNFKYWYRNSKTGKLFAGPAPKARVASEPSTKRVDAENVRRATADAGARAPAPAKTRAEVAASRQAGMQEWLSRQRHVTRNVPHPYGLTGRSTTVEVAPNVFETTPVPVSRATARSAAKRRARAFAAAEAAARKVAEDAKLDIFEMKADDIKKLKRNKFLLGRFVQANGKFIGSVARQFFWKMDRSETWDDLMQEGRLSLIRAARKAKPGFTPEQFRSYAYMAVRSGIRDAITAKIEEMTMGSIFDPESGELIEAAERIQGAGAPSQTSAEIDQMIHDDVVAKMRMQVPEGKKRKIFDMLAAGHKRAEIARRLRVSKVYVTQEIDRSIKPIFAQYFKSEQFRRDMLDLVKAWALAEGDMDMAKSAIEAIFQMDDKEEGEAK